jgi:molecular chaperone IbpA
MSIVRFDPFRAVRDFDRLTGELFQGGNSSWAPAYDIEHVDENRYVVSLAVPGYADEDLEIVTKERELVVKGSPKANGENKTYIRKSIARRPFVSSFALGDHVEVRNAKLDRGVLTIELQRELPEALKPRQIAISSEPAQQAA